MFELGPILKILWRNPTGPLLIILQLALSIAIVSNALSFISQRYDYISRDPGIDVSGLIRYLVQQDQSMGTLDESVRNDLAYIRSLRAVKSAVPITGVPMGGMGGTTSVSTEPSVDGQSSTTGTNTDAAMLRIGEDGIVTLGARLREGRDFLKEEYTTFSRGGEPKTGSVILTHALAKTLFPNDDNVLGKTVYEGNNSAFKVIGIVDDLFGHFIDWDYSRQVIIFPALEMENSVSYIVRVDDHGKSIVQSDIARALSKTNKGRIIDEGKTMEAIQASAYAGDHAMITLLSVVLILLVGVNALGIVGLMSFWVAQRRKQIGIRRALGATRLAIVRYFLIENMVIVVIASGIGSVAAMTASAYMVTAYGFAPLPWLFIPVASAVVLFITLAASIAPVRRASFISPVEAVSGN